MKIIERNTRQSQRPTMGANDRQVGGDHYRKSKTALQHWDVVASLEWDYFQGNITKYVDRHRRKGGFEDLMKARHYLDKYMEVAYPEEYARMGARENEKSTVGSFEHLREQHDENERQAMDEYAASLDTDKGDLRQCHEGSCHGGVRDVECAHYAPKDGR